MGSLPFALFPSRALDRFLDALWQSVALHAQAVDRDAGRLEQIALANLGGIQSYFGGKFVQLRFEGEADVDGAVTAHGSADRLVGQDAVAVVLNVGDVVERAQQRAGIKNGDDAVGAVGSAVLDDAGFDGGDAAVVRDAGLQIDDGARTSAMRPEDFFAGVGDLHRGKRFSRRNGGDDFERNDFTLSAEASAHQRLDDANLRHRHFEDQRKFVLQVVRNLRRRPNRQASAVAGVRIDFERSQRRVRLHGRVGDFVGDEASFGYLVGFGEAFVGIAEDVVVVLFEVVRLVVVDEVGLGLHRFFGIEVGGQEFVFDIDQFERFFGGGLVDGGDAGDVVADVADFVEGERVLVVADGKNAVGIGRVFAGDDGDDAFEFLGAAGVNALDAGVRVRRMQDSADRACRAG